MSAPWWFQYAVAGLIGLCLGSFFMTLAQRLPVGQSILAARSACPGCGRRLTAWELIPVVGFLVLQGRCRDCGQAIDRLSPLVELFLAAWAVWLVRRWGLGLDWAALSLAGGLLVSLAVMDWRHRILPQWPTLILAAGGLAWRGLSLGRPWEALLGAVICGGLLAGVRWAYQRLAHREGMGAGDPKLAAGLGAWLGTTAGLQAIVLAAGGGAIWGLIMVLSNRQGWRAELPLGSFLGLAGLVMLALI